LALSFFVHRRCGGSVRIREMALFKLDEVMNLKEMTVMFIHHLGPIATLQTRCVGRLFCNMLNPGLLSDAFGLSKFSIDGGYQTNVSEAEMLFHGSSSLCEYVRNYELNTDDAVCRVLSALSQNSVSQPNVHGQTALMWAAGRGHASFCSFLLAANAELDATDSSGWTALMHAAWYGHARSITTLLKARADVETASTYYTPLMAAARFGHLDAVHELLAFSASTSVTTRFGETALSLSRDMRHQSVTSLLEGADMPDHKLGPDPCCSSKPQAQLVLGCAVQRSRHVIRGARRARAEFEAAISSC